jgi:hypothetical protein
MKEAEQLKYIKTLLSLTDESQNEILVILLHNAVDMICAYLGLEDMPPELDFVAQQMVIVRYHRLGSEGITTEKIDVLSTTYSYNLDELAPYKTVLDKYKQNNLNGRRAKFL